MHTTLTKAKIDWSQIRGCRHRYSLFTSTSSFKMLFGCDASSSHWPLLRNFLHVLYFKRPLWSSPCVSIAVFSATRIWCMMMSPDRRKTIVWKLNIPAAGMRGTLTVSLSLPPWGYQAAVGTDQSLLQHNRKTSIYLSTQCLLQKTGRVKGR